VNDIWTKTTFPYSCLRNKTPAAFSKLQRFCFYSNFAAKRPALFVRDAALLAIGWATDKGKEGGGGGGGGMATLVSLSISHGYIYYSLPARPNNLFTRNNIAVCGSAGRAGDAAEVKAESSSTSFELAGARKISEKSQSNASLYRNW
jgi:hypothetical protein